MQAMNHQPLVSIIIPCYNQQEFIDYTLENVCNQTYKNWECIIVNDGSTDDSEEIIKKWLAYDNRMVYHKKKNGGLSSARNAGLDLAKGEYIQFLDGDDALDADKLKESVNAALQKQMDLVITNFHMFKRDISNLRPVYCKLEEQTFDFENILLEWDSKFTIPIHCGFFHKSLFKNIRFNEALKAKEDWLMWISVFKLPVRVYFINLKYAYYRVNLSGMTRDYVLMNQNLIKAYNFIYQELNEEYQLKFFNKIIQDYNKQILELNERVQKEKRFFLLKAVDRIVYLIRRKMMLSKLQ